MTGDYVTGRVFFGERWDAPIVDDAEQVPTPVGETCFWCHQPIVAGDRGFLTPVAIGPHEVETRPEHMECGLPGVFGGPAHVRGECSHTGSCIEGWDDRRALGLATLAAVNEQRASQGQAPL